MCAFRCVVCVTGGENPNEKTILFREIRTLAAVLNTLHLLSDICVLTVFSFRYFPDALAKVYLWNYK